MERRNQVVNEKEDKNYSVKVKRTYGFLTYDSNHKYIN